MEETTEVQELSLEKIIETKLVQNNVTEQVLAELKSRYGGLTLKAIDDKESYLDIVAARKEVRKVGIITEKICKMGREDANRTRTLWIEKEKEVLAKIDQVQLPLESEIKKFDDEVARKENEEKEKREFAFQQRQATLIKYGAAYSNGSFELNHISYDIDNIRDSDEEIWMDIILPKYKGEFEKLQAEIVAEENKRAAEARLLKEQQDKLREEQEEFNRQKKEMQDKIDDLKRQQDIIDRDARAVEQERIYKKSADEEKLWRGRLSELKNIVWNSQEVLSKHDEELVLTYDELINLSDESFGIVRDAHNKKSLEIEAKKLELRLEQELQEKAAAIEQALREERERVAKQRADEELKAAQEMEQADDKTKWAIWIQIFKAAVPPTMKSKIYTRKVAIAKEKIEEIISL